MVFPREILIIKNAQVFYINFRLRGEHIYSLHYQTCKVLVGKRVAFGKDEKLQLGLFNVKS